MSFVQSHADPAARAKAIFVVAGVHALLGAGLILGLHYTKVITAETKLIGYEFPEEVPETNPPPPPDEKQVVDTFVPPTAPIPKVDLGNKSDVQPTSLVPTPPLPSNPIPTPTAVATLAPPPPVPTPSARFTPTSPRVTNRQARWITNDDYSNTDIRRGNEGTASFELVIGSNGRVNDCQITTSTGHETLDRATCRLISQRARFDAAKDENGQAVVGTFTGQVTWQIPE